MKDFHDETVKLIAISSKCIKFILVQRSRLKETGLWKEWCLTKQEGTLRFEMVILDFLQQHRWYSDKTKQNGRLKTPAYALCVNKKKTVWNMILILCNVSRQLWADVEYWPVQLGIDEHKI